MSRVFGLGDAHFYHDKVIKFRTQFETVQDHDIYIYENIVKTVGKRDKLILFGDIFMPTDFA